MMLPNDRTNDDKRMNNISLIILFYKMKKKVERRKILFFTINWRFEILEIKNKNCLKIQSLKLRLKCLNLLEGNFVKKNNYIK